jgi:pyrroline-5-carboxylate reductase
MNIHIIGGGNLGVAIAIGINKFTSNNSITITRRNISSIQYLENDGIIVSSSNILNIQNADLVILTIKPYQVDIVIKEILPFINEKTIIASAVSGLSIEELQLKSNLKNAVIHIMPNIAIRFGQSATCISFAEGDKIEAQKVINLFENLGTVALIDEKLMDAATVLGACGTAYALRYIRASMQAGIEIGFDAATALSIASQTAKGAATMALEEKIHPEQLIDRVTTPQGCTIVGLNEMEHEGFSSSLIKGIKTSLKKIKE